MNQKLNRHLRNEELPASAVVHVHVGTLIMNALLLVAALGLLAYYVVQANALSALQFDIGASSDEIVHLREEHHAVGAQVADLEHPDHIAEYALSAGMVIAGDASYVSIPDAPLAGR